MKPLLIALSTLLLVVSPTLYAQSDEDAADKGEEVAAREALREELEQARRDVAKAAGEMARIQRELADMNLEALRTGQLKGLDEQLQELEGEVVGVGSLMNEEVIRRLHLRHGRPRLGVLLGGEDDTSQIVGVTPGSGAEKAGIESGDRLVSINGRDVDASDRQSLRAAMEGIELGDTVPVEIERDGERMSLEVTVSSPARDFRVIAHDIKGPPPAPDVPDAPGLDREVIVLKGDREFAPEPPMPPRLAGLGRHSDMISNHPGLEPYFGTGEGVLVLRIDPENPLGLQDGDVVMRIDGEVVSRPVEIGRALLGHGGQTVTLEVMRGGEAVTIDAELPEGKAVSALLRHFRPDL